MKYTWTITIIFLLAVMAGGSWYVNNKIPKTAYVQNNRIFDGFIGKKELEKKMIERQEGRQAIIDSLVLELRVLSAQVSIEKNPSYEVVDKLQSVKKRYDRLSKEFANQDKFDQDQYREQIWQQINQYLKEFGKANGYDYIFGAGGIGSLMYADEGRADITKEFIKYINNKYDSDR